MGHVRRMQHNRRRLIHRMIKERERDTEKRNSDKPDVVPIGEGEVPPIECSDISEQSGRDR